MWHTDFESTFRGLPAMLEVKLGRWLPKGWDGTADWIVWSDEYRAFVLGDLKTIKPEGMAWIEKDGIKEEHRWQVSSYWYALRNMGLPLVKGYMVYYLPMSPLIGKDISPLLLEGKLIDESIIIPHMEDRWNQTQAYLSGILPNLKSSKGVPHESYYLREHLAPVQERHQVVRWNKAMGVFDIKLEPHWSANYCPFPNELCDCSTQRSEKIGHYMKWLDEVQRFVVNYVPRKGYEDVPIEVTLTTQQERKLLGD